MSLRLSFVLLLASSVLAEMVIVQTDNWLNYTISGQAPNSTELFAFRDYDYVSPRLPQFDSNQDLSASPLCWFDEPVSFNADAFKTQCQDKYEGD